MTYVNSLLFDACSSKMPLHCTCFNVSKMLRNRQYLLPLICIAGVVASCSFPQKPEKKVGDKIYQPDNYKLKLGEKGQALSIKYIGCGGLVIDYKGEIIITDPFFSNNASLRSMSSSALGLGKVKSKPEMVDWAIDEHDLSDAFGGAKALLIGHAHYDHLMDVPFLLKHNCLSKEVKVYGSKSTQDILTRYLYGRQFIDFDSLRTKTKTEWEKLTQHIYMKPILSSHAPHFGCIHLMQGEVDACFRELKDDDFKTKANKWKEGKVYAYLLRITADWQAPFYIHVMTSSSSSPSGIPEGQKVDLSILCAASTQNVDEFPANVLQATQPKKVILIHWEDFFRSYKKPSKSVKGTNFKTLLGRLASHKADLPNWVSMPEKGVTITCEF